MEKAVNYTRIVCQNAEDVLPNMFVIFHPKILRILRMSIAYERQYAAGDLEFAQCNLSISTKDKTKLQKSHKCYNVKNQGFITTITEEADV